MIIGINWQVENDSILKKDGYVDLHFRQEEGGKYTLSQYHAGNIPEPDPEILFSIYPDKKSIEVISIKDAIGIKNKDIGLFICIISELFYCDFKLHFI